MCPPQRQAFFLSEFVNTPEKLCEKISSAKQQKLLLLKVGCCFLFVVFPFFTFKSNNAPKEKGSDSSAVCGDVAQYGTLSACLFQLSLRNCTFSQKAFPAASPATRVSERLPAERTYVLVAFCSPCQIGGWVANAHPV